MPQTTGEKSARPFLRILRDMEARIDRREFAPGDFLPTRDALADQYKVAKATVDKALVELGRRGVLDSRSGRRTLVLDRKAKAKDVANIGVLWHWPEDQERLGSDYLDLLFRGIREACAEFMLEVHFRSAPLYRWKELVDEKGAQGLLIVRPDYADETVIDGIHQAGVPVVLVPGVLDESPVASISADNTSGIGAAVDHLVDLGHHHIGLVCLTATLPDHFERLQAFLKANARRRLVVQPGWICLDHERNPSLFRERLSTWLSPDDHPSAIISCDFIMTLALLSRLSELGLSVPKDISVVTFDDPIMASQMVPALTSVSQPTPQLGFRAIERLRELIAGRDVPHVEKLPTTLIIRDSTTTPCR